MFLYFLSYILSGVGKASASLFGLKAETSSGSASSGGASRHADCSFNATASADPLGDMDLGSLDPMGDAMFRQNKVSGTNGIHDYNTEIALNSGMFSKDTEPSIEDNFVKFDDLDIGSSSGLFGSGLNDNW